MTWQDVRVAALQKMFSLEGTTINETDESIRDYLAAMPTAANEGILRLATVGMPVIRTHELGYKAPGKPMVLDLAETLPDFYALELLTQTIDDIPTPIYSAKLVAGKKLVIPAGVQGALALYYQALPKTITASTPDEEPIDLAAEAAVLLPLYIASQLYKEDDLTLATGYRNEFEAALTELQQRSPMQHFDSDFTTVTHWW